MDYKIHKNVCCKITSLLKVSVLLVAAVNRLLTAAGRDDDDGGARGGIKEMAFKWLVMSAESLIYSREERKHIFKSVYKESPFAGCGSAAQESH